MMHRFKQGGQPNGNQERFGYRHKAETRYEQQAAVA